jgi:hypothetical protein
MNKLKPGLRFTGTVVGQTFTTVTVAPQRNTDDADPPCVEVRCDDPYKHFAFGTRIRVRVKHERAGIVYPERIDIKRLNSHSETWERVE